MTQCVRKGKENDARSKVRGPRTGDQEDFAPLLRFFERMLALKHDRVVCSVCNGVIV